MEHPTEMDDLGGSPILGKPHMVYDFFKGRLDTKMI